MIFTAMTNRTLDDFIKKLEKEKVDSKGKWSAISEIAENKVYRLKVKKIYKVSSKPNYTYLFIVKNHEKTPKIRYFLSHTLASVSSDFLVSLAKEFAMEHGLKLIQYSLYPHLLRLSLLTLKELTSSEHFSEILTLFGEFRNLFKTRLKRLQNLVK